MLLARAQGAKTDGQLQKQQTIINVIFVYYLFHLLFHF